MVWALLALGAVPTVGEAEALANKKQWDELYLAWASVKIDAVAQADKKRVAKALGKGCAALVGSDAVMAQSLGEKSVAFEPQADPLLCAAKAAVKTEQRGEAEGMLRSGRKQFATDDRFALELGRLLVTENDGANALVELKTIGKKSKQYKEAQPVLAKATALVTQYEKSHGDLTAAEQAALKQQEVATNEAGAPPPGEPAGPGPRKGKPPPPLAPSGVGSSTYESGVDDEGRRTRSNAHFRFRYFNGQRDFGQRADYEGRVQAALEEARNASDRLLGTARESPTDVILYSKEEFTMHHGTQAARSIAGFYSENAIRMNDSAEINAQNQAVLVHEYVHAVLDEVTHFHDERVPIWLNEGFATWVEWRYTGFDGPPPLIAKQLQNVALQKRLPSLVEMSKTALVNQDNPALRYNVSGAAVHLLLKDGGTANLLGLFADCGAGEAFEAVFEKRYGKTLAEFEEKLADELKSS